MVFKGKLYYNYIPIYIDDLTFTKTQIIVERNLPINKGALSLNSITLIPNHTEYTIDFWEKNDPSVEVSEIAISYTVNGREYYTTLKANWINRIKAKLMHDKWFVTITQIKSGAAWVLTLVIGWFIIHAIEVRCNQTSTSNSQDSTYQDSTRTR